MYVSTVLRHQLPRTERCNRQHLTPGAAANCCIAHALAEAAPPAGLPAAFGTALVPTARSAAASSAASATSPAAAPAQEPCPAPLLAGPPIRSSRAPLRLSHPDRSASGLCPDPPPALCTGAGADALTTDAPKRRYRATAAWTPTWRHAISQQQVNDFLEEIMFPVQEEQPGPASEWKLL